MLGSCIHLLKRLDLPVTLPVHLPACSRDRAGSWGHIWERVPREVFLPGLPRVSSCGGLRPEPRCPAEGCNAGAGALDSQKETECGGTHHVNVNIGLFQFSTLSETNYRKLLVWQNYNQTLLFSSQTNGEKLITLVYKNSDAAEIHCDQT